MQRFSIWIYERNRRKILVRRTDNLKEAEAFAFELAKVNRQVVVTDSVIGSRIWERGLIYSTHHGDRLDPPNSDAVKKAYEKPQS